MSEYKEVINLAKEYISQGYNIGQAIEIAIDEIRRVEIEKYEK